MNQTTKRWLESFQSLEVPSLFVTEARKKLMEGPSMPMGFFRGFPECKKMICRKRLETLQGSERHRFFFQKDLEFLEFTWFERNLEKVPQRPRKKCVKLQIALRKANKHRVISSDIRGTLLDQKWWKWGATNLELLIHPGKSIAGTQKWRFKVWKIIFLFNWVIFRFHVNFPGCIFRSSSNQTRFAATFSRYEGIRGGHDSGGHTDLYGTRDSGNVASVWL